MSKHQPQRHGTDRCVLTSEGVRAAHYHAGWRRMSVGSRGPLRSEEIDVVVATVASGWQSIAATSDV